MFRSGVGYLYFMATILGGHHAIFSTKAKAAIS
jgi:hypothetical protein